MPAALIAISVGVLATAAVLKVILDGLDEFTGDIALDQAYDGGKPVDEFA